MDAASAPLEILEALAVRVDATHEQEHVVEGRAMPHDI